jgi:hypothetical protein
MVSVVDATGKGIVIDCSSPSLEPGKQTSSDLGRNFELHWSSSLLLDDSRPSSNVVAGDECPDFQLYQIAAAELAVDGKIEKRPISHPSFTVQEEADCPDLALLQRLLVSARKPTSALAQPAHGPIPASNVAAALIYYWRTGGTAIGACPLLSTSGDSSATETKALSGNHFRKRGP